MDRTKKKKIIKKLSKHETDTGSTRVQVGILTERINDLSKHLDSHKNDSESRRGLLALVGNRRKLLNYLKLHRPEEYSELTESLSLKS